jgi:putative membrane protein
MSILRAVLATSAVIAFSAMGMSPVAAQPGVSDQDRSFLISAHQVNLAEIAAGRLGQERGQASVVRSIGALLVKDHTQLDTELRAKARKLRVSLPAQPTPEQRAEYARLAAMSGAEFDRAWVEAMIQGHRAALAACAQQLRSGSAPEAKQVAASATPVIRGHLERLLRAREVVGAPRKAPAGTRGQAMTVTGQRPLALGYGLFATGALITAGGVLLWRYPARWKR